MRRRGGFSRRACMWAMARTGTVASVWRYFEHVPEKTPGSEFVGLHPLVERTDTVPGPISELPPIPAPQQRPSPLADHAADPPESPRQACRTLTSAPSAPPSPARSAA